MLHQFSTTLLQHYQTHNGLCKKDQNQCSRDRDDVISIPRIIVV